MSRSDAVPRREASVPPPQQEPLTDVEQQILDFMVDYLRANTYQPSIREIGHRFGIKSTKTVSEHLQALADKGHLERDPSRSRGVKILSVDLGARTVQVPCYARWPEDGQPGNGADAETVVSIDRHLGGEEGAYMIRASGGELAVLGVEDGDLVLVCPTTHDDVADGTVVVAVVDGDPGFHRVVRASAEIHLESLQPGGGSTVFEETDGAWLLGRVAGLYRRMDDLGSVNLTHH